MQGAEGQRLNGGRRVGQDREGEDHPVRRRSCGMGLAGSSFQLQSRLILCCSYLAVAS